MPLVAIPDGRPSLKPARSWEGWRALLAGLRLPAALVDLDAVEANARTMLAVSDPRLKLRIATKSLRLPWLCRHLLALDRRQRGLMCWSAHEAAFMADLGFDDILIAYPCARPDEAEAVAGLVRRGLTVRPMVDAPEHLALLEAAARAAGVEIRAVLDVDASLRILGAHLGVRRSPIRDAEAAVALAAAARGPIHIDGIMAYEAQVAGMRDHNPSSRTLDPVRGLIKARSMPAVMARRAAVVEALRAEGHAIALVNGGGTGSLRQSSADPTLTELTAGSGYLCAHLFDGYDGLDLSPAAFFALAVCRRSDPDHVTCAMGGVLASGPPGSDRQPLVHAPPNLAPVALEGWGEVQTPFRLLSGEAPRIGDPVICRPAKSGEWLERFDEVLLLRGDRIVGRERTIRGLGGCFL